MLRPNKHLVGTGTEMFILDLCGVACWVSLSSGIVLITILFPSNPNFVRQK